MQHVFVCWSKCRIPSLCKFSSSFVNFDPPFVTFLLFLAKRSICLFTLALRSSFRFCFFFVVHVNGATVSSGIIAVNLIPFRVFPDVVCFVPTPFFSLVLKLVAFDVRPYESLAFCQQFTFSPFGVDSYLIDGFAWASIYFIIHYSIPIELDLSPVPCHRTKRSYH